MRLKQLEVWGFIDGLLQIAVDDMSNLLVN